MACLLEISESMWLLSLSDIPCMKLLVIANEKYLENIWLKLSDL